MNVYVISIYFNDTFPYRAFSDEVIDVLLLLLILLLLLLLLLLLSAVYNV